MPRIWHENKTVEWRTNAEDEAMSRIGLQELLDNNPGYTPVLIVEDVNGNETTITDLSSSPSASRRRATSEVIVEEPPVVVEEETEISTDGDGDDDGGDEEED